MPSSQIRTTDRALDLHARACAAWQAINDIAQRGVVPDAGLFTDIVAAEDAFAAATPGTAAGAIAKLRHARHDHVLLCSVRCGQFYSKPPRKRIKRDGSNEWGAVSLARAIDLLERGHPQWLGEALNECMAYLSMYGSEDGLGGRGKRAATQVRGVVTWLRAKHRRAH